jgi:iron complex transport system substrate-binding protein
MARRGAPRAPATRFVALTLATAGFVACGGPGGSSGAEGREATGDAVVIKDADGRVVRLAGPARRIVSLVPSATLTLGALGAQASVVARTDFDTASWTRSLPSVGGGLQPSVEAIVSVHPDLVVRFGGPQDAKTAERLGALGIPQISVRPDRVEDVLDIIALLGRATGRVRAADSLVRSIRAELDAVRASVAGLPKVRTVYILGGSPPWVAGPGTYIDELITLGGGVNVFSDLGSKYAAVSPEEIVARDVETVLTPPGSTFDRRLLPDVQVKTVSAALELPGPAVAEAARDVAHLLHPGVAGGRGP